MNEARCLFCRVRADGKPEPCTLHVEPPAHPEAPAPTREELPATVYRCGKCGVLGHNRRSCTAPERALASDVRKR